MQPILAGLQTFGTAFPFEIAAKNQFQGANLPVLYIVDKIDPNDAAQQIGIDICPANTNSYTLKGFAFTPPASPSMPAPLATATLAPSNASFTPDDTHYNLAIVLRPGTLRQELINSFSVILQNSISASLGATNNCVVNGPVVRSTDGALLWYVALQNDIQTSAVNWKKATSSLAMRNVIVLADGSLVGVATNNNYYTMSSLQSGNWQQVNVSWQLNSISIYGNGNFVCLSTNGMVYVASNTPQSPGTEIPNMGSVRLQTITVLPDNSLLGIDNTNTLQYLPAGNNSSWTAIPDPVSMISVSAKSDGSLVGVGKDNKLYKRAGVQNAQWTLDNSCSMPLTGIAVAPNGSLIAIGTDGQLYTPAVESRNSILSFMLKGISAAAGTGARSSQLEIKLGNVYLNGSGNPLSFRRSEHIDIVNHQGHSYAPLYFGVLGNGTLLNQQGYDNDLSIYFETFDGNPVELSSDANAPTEINFSFPYSSGSSDLIHFGLSDEVKAYKIAPTEKYPFSSNGIGQDTGNGAIQFNVAFNNLQTIEQTLTLNPSDKLSSSKATFTAVPNPDPIATIISNAASRSQQLASFITSDSGPIQGYLNATSQNNITLANALASGKIPVINANLSSSATQPAIGFDFIQWYQSGYGKPLQPWDSLPTGLTSDYDPTTPWKNIALLQYICSNYNTLIAQLQELNPAAVGNTNYNNSPVQCVFPCRTLYEFFKTQYDLQQDLLAAYTTGSNATGPQGAAINQAKATLAQTVDHAQKQSLQLLTFICDTNGPIAKLVGSSILRHQNCSLQDQWKMGLPYAYTVSDKPGVVSFASAKWDECVQQAEKDLTLSWDILPPEISCEYDPSNLWSDQNFTNYVNTNFATLYATIQGIILGGNLSNLEAHSITDLRFFPCKAIYAFLRTQYNLQQSLNSFVPAFMLDISAPFTTTSWDKTVAAAIQELPAANTLLLQSSVNNTSQDWNNTGLVNFVTQQFTSLCQSLNPFTCNQKKYIVPCQSLYDYLEAAYEAAKPVSNNINGASLNSRSSYVFTFTNVQVSGEDGIVTLGVSIRNLPGYWDTNFQVYVRKSKTTANATLRLGIGDGIGRTMILPTDPNYTNNTGLQPGSRIDFLTGGQTNNQPNISIEEFYGLNLYGVLPSVGNLNPSGLPLTKGDTTINGLPVRIKQADLLIEDGRIGIGNVPKGDLTGDFTNPDDASTNGNQNEKLRVVGDSYLQGGLSLTGNLLTQSDVTINGSVTIQGDINLLGSLKDSTPPLIPVGTMIQQVYYLNPNLPATPPPGWLFCNGQSIIQEYMMVKGTDGGSTINIEFLPLFLFLAQQITMNGVNSKVLFNPSVVVQPAPQNPGRYVFFDPVSNQQSGDTIDRYDISLPLIQFNSNVAMGNQNAFTYQEPNLRNFASNQNQQNYMQILYLIKY